MPNFVGGPLLYDDQFIIPQEALSDVMLYAIRRMNTAELAALPDLAEGFENVLYRVVREARSLTEFYEKIKTKRYTLARCKRIVTSALLGITADQVRRLTQSREGSYLKVLGFRRQARALISEIAQKKTAPLLLRNSDLESFPGFIRQNIETDMLSTDILSFVTTQEIKRDLSGAVIL